MKQCKEYVNILQPESLQLVTAVRPTSRQIFSSSLWNGMMDKQSSASVVQ